MDPMIIKQIAAQTCSTDNMTIMRGQMIRLFTIRSMIMDTIRQAERDKSSAALINNVLFGLQMVKATCDVIVAVGSEMTPKGALLSAGYSALQPNAENVGKLMSGQNLGTTDILTGVNAGVNAAVKRRLGFDSPLVEFADITKVKADVVINASALDEKALLISVGEYNAGLAIWAAKEAGNLALSKLIKTGVELSKAGLAYHAAFSEWKKGDMNATFEAGMELSRRQLTTINRQISNVERELANCGIKLPKHHTTSIGLITGKPVGPTLRAGR